MLASELQAIAPTLWEELTGAVPFGGDCCPDFEDSIDTALATLLRCKMLSLFVCVSGASNCKSTTLGSGQQLRSLCLRDWVLHKCFGYHG